jgi:MFS family permease
VNKGTNNSRPSNYSTWSPLRQSLFRGFLLAALVSNIGTWMHDVGASWLMASLTSSPLMVALVKAAMSLPIFLFALPAGALADILDRRRLLIGTQCWMLLIAGILAATALMGIINPWILLSWLCCKNYFEVRNFFERISLDSNLKYRGYELRLPHRIISV